MRKKFTCKPSTTAIKAATTADMLDAFEGKLADFGIQSKTNISCDDNSDSFDRSVQIDSDDYQYSYKDVEGGFGEPGEIYSLAEIKDFWNRENMNDPVLVDYPSYELWWNDTLSNFLKEVEN